MFPLFIESDTKPNPMVLLNVSTHDVEGMSPRNGA